MHLITTFIIAIYLIMIQGCATSPQHPTQEDNASLNDPNSIRPIQMVFRGRLILGEQTATFSPCHSKQQYLLTLPVKTYRRIIKRIPAPYQAVYGEIIGSLAITSLYTGQEGDYLARLRVAQVNFIHPDADKMCREQPQTTLAFGLKPHWKVALQPTSMSVTLPKQSLASWALIQATTSIEERKEQRQYTSPNGTLTLAERPCYFSDRILYGWSATFNAENNSYQGCGRLSNIDPSLSWVGEYAAKSTETTHFSVTLSLAADHSAVTQYHYQDDPTPLTETGFWQALNDHQIQVVMTQHQRQYLLSQRIFSRQGNAIYTETEQVGQRVFPIEGSLMLYRSENTPK